MEMLSVLLLSETSYYLNYNTNMFSKMFGISGNFNNVKIAQTFRMYGMGQCTTEVELLFSNKSLMKWGDMSANS